MIVNLLYITILILLILTIVYMISTCNKSNFINTPTIEEQQIDNNEFLEAYNKFKKREQEQEKNEVPYNWNLNNTLESMKLNPCLATDKNSGRMSCFTGPAWWYPEKAYKAENFRSQYNGDYYNPIYNYLGNAQEMFWDFKSVKDPIVNSG